MDLPEYRQTTPARSYTRSAPNIFNAVSNQKPVLQNYYTMIAQREVNCPAEGFHHFKRCHVYDGAYVLTDDAGWFVPSVLNYAIAAQIEKSLQDLVAAGHARPLAAAGRATVLIAQAGFSNYGHVLSDMLPKLINLGIAGLGAVRLLLPEAMRFLGGMIAGIVGHIGIDAAIEYVSLGTLLSVEDVYLFSAVSQHDSRKSITFLLLRDVIYSFYSIKPSRERRFFIRRGDADIRRLVNAKQVQTLFAERGFEQVYPPDLSIEQQIRLFATASDIAGPLGAGLANIAFAPEATQVLMIDPGLIDYYFWDFACLLSQRFSWFFAGEIRGWSEELASAHYSVNETQMRSCLDILYG